MCATHWTEQQKSIRPELEGVGRTGPSRRTLPVAQPPSSLQRRLPPDYGGRLMRRLAELTKSGLSNGPENAELPGPSDSSARIWRLGHKGGSDLISK